MIVIHHEENLLSLLENGYISSSGDADREGYVRTKGYLQFSGEPSNITVHLDSSKTLLMNFVGYQNQSPSPIICDLYWYEQPAEFNLSSYSNLNYYRLLFKRKDGVMSLDTSDISNCTIEYDESYVWYIDKNGEFHNDEMHQFSEDTIIKPLPKNQWRISRGINNGFPYHELLNDIISIFFIWELTSDSLTTIPDSQKKNYWKQLLEWLHESTNSGRDNRVFDYNFKEIGLSVEPQLLLSTIMKDIDLDLLPEDEVESFIDNLIKSYKTAKVLREDQSKMALWNKSLHHLWQKLYRKYIPETRNIYEGESLSLDENNNLVTTGENALYGSLETEGVSLRLKDILNADAGANFYKSPYDGSVVLHPWVLPWYNIDGDSYSDVRADDKIISALYNDTQLNFTEHQDSESIYTRLLMPQNDRRVEVEDLNRNFWVIAQAITAIQNEIFGSSSIGEIIKGIIKELADLWENILYLWGGTAIIAQTPKYPLHEIIFTPLYESDFRPYLKYDNFDKNVISEDNLKKILSPILKEYQNTNLLITPEVRLNNYEKNYFSEVQFPFFLRYNRNLDDWENSQVANIIITANDTELQNRTYGVKLFDNKIEYCYPFSNISNEDVGEGRYYNIIRLEFIYSASQSTYSMFSIELYDVGYEIVNTKILDNGIKNIPKRKIATVTYTANSNNVSFNYEDNTDWLVETGITDVLTGFYQGDLLSGYIDKGGD